MEVRTSSGEPVDLGPPQRQIVLAVLLAEAGLVVSTDRMLQAIWGEDAEPGRISSLQAHISRLRATLGAEVVRTRRPGYSLDTSQVLVDTAEAATIAQQGRSRLEAGDWKAATEKFRALLGLWRGRPYAEFRGLQFFEWEIARLEELRLEVSEDLAAAMLETGSNTEVITQLEPLMRDNPLRERLRALLMLALYRSGRQADALGVYRDLRSHLVDSLGLEPSRELEELEARVLNHDPSLVATTQATTLATTTTIRRTAVTDNRGFLTFAEERFPLHRPVTTIGRRSDRDIVVSDEEVSRRHAEVRRLPGGYLLVDVGSANGTQVNGHEVVEHHLEAGDVITIGGTTFVYSSDPS